MEFERNSDENRTKITKVMENHRNYAELASKSHRIACIPAEFARKSHGIHRIFAWKSHRNHKNHGKPQKLFGIQPEFPRKSHENREKHGKSQKLRGTEFIGFRMGPRPRGHPSSPRRVPPPSSAALAPRPPPTPGSPALSPFPLFSVSLPRLLHPSRPCLRSENPHGPKGQ